jgi:DNA-binding LacI/PurR family transcriptional regulator
MSKGKTTGDEASSRPVRLADVAKAAGVSQGTASNVFSRPEVVRAEVRERVLAAAQAIGYAGPDLRGRLLRAGKVNAIGIASVDPMTYFFEDPYARTLMQSIAEACDAKGAGLSLVSAKRTDRLAWNIDSALVDGFILLCVEHGEELVRLTQARQLPFVALALGGGDDNVPALGVDDRAGARRAAEHIAALGHRRVAIISLQFVEFHNGPVTPQEIDAGIYLTTKSRAHGYLDGLAAHGILPDDVPIWETQNDTPTVITALEALFSAEHPPTALLCMSDRAALVALDWLMARGINVPGQVSVIGFDGVPEAERSEPPLTTIQQPIAAMGRRAAEAILDGEPLTRREVFALTLVERASTGPAPR